MRPLGMFITLATHASDVNQGRKMDLDLMRSESSRQPFTNSSLVNSPSPLMSNSLKIFLARSAALS